MKNLIASILLLSLVAGASFAFAANLTVPITSVTVYSNGYSYIERSISTSMGQGQSSLFVANFSQNAIFDSISASDSGGAITYQRFYSRLYNKTETTSRQMTTFELLNQSIGSKITVSTQSGQHIATLVWVSPDSIGVTTSGVFSMLKLSDISELSFSPSSYLANDTTTTQAIDYGLEIGEVSKSSNHNIDITYMAPSQWAANYKVYLDKPDASGQATVQSWANIQNTGGEDWNSVPVTLVIGSPKMASEPIRYNSYDIYAKSSYGAGNSMAVAPPEVLPQYTMELLAGNYKISLGGTVSLRDGESASYPIFSKSLGYQRENVWDTNIGQTEKTVKLKNDGSMPYPSGVYRVYDQGLFAGEDSVAFSAKGDSATVAYSYMPEVSVSRDMTQDTTQVGNSRVTTYSVTLVASNKGDTQTPLTVKDYMYQGDKVAFVSGTPMPEIKGNTDLTWHLNIAPGTNQSIQYTYTVANYLQNGYYPSPLPATAPA